MPVTQLSGRHGGLHVTLDGIRFTRSEVDALRRGTGRVHEVGWERVTGASVQTTGKGRTVIRVAVADVPAGSHHRDDPYAVKIPRKKAASAHELVDQINAEVEGRRRWRRHATEDAAPHLPA